MSLTPSSIEGNVGYQVSIVQPGFWQRARRVWVDDDDFLWCELDSSSSYNLVQAYSREPHVGFLNAKSDDDLLDFVGTWGPLTIPDGSSVGKSVLSIHDVLVVSERAESDYWIVARIPRGKKVKAKH